MILDKIKFYLLNQIFKNFLLIFFIFLSISWLLQITRLFTISNFLHINVYEIFILSIYLIPNLITIIIPFILIFGLILCFVKLNRDNELIAIFSLGFGLKPLKNTLIYFTIVILFIFSVLNFYLAPIIYEIYKKQEYELRNTLDLNKMSFSNFLNLNQSTVLNFNKTNNEYEDIFISFKDERDNIIYAKKGNIFNENNQYNFQLINGFKISIDEKNNFEKLEFLNYILKIENKNIGNSDIVDKNTFTIFDDYRSKNFLNICFKFFDIIIILFIIYFFYNNNIKSFNLKSINNIFFCSLSIALLIINQILQNSDVNIYNYSFLILIAIFTTILISNYKNKYE